MMAFSSAESFTTGLPVEESMVFSFSLGVNDFGAEGAAWVAAVGDGTGVGLALADGLVVEAPVAGFEPRCRGCINQARAAPREMNPRMNKKAAIFFMAAR